ncbi:hypothetical protein [Streptomyces sp. NBC_01431]|uniref:hypothetical protein n=1 Tax=Streptomyces sp. NBC_01431 TaxID=2903863 RepID=UPI002E35CDFE|nr:hypothetical protein [Streptomyces sp. NBC_01431]
MQKTSGLRRIHPACYVRTCVAVPATVAPGLQSTGMYDSWRNGGSAVGPASATATCPRSTERAAFPFARCHDTNAHPAAPRHRHSPDFANAAMTAFANNEAEQRACTDAELVARP